MNRTQYDDVSTDDVKDRRNNVEMLWLDVVEHKLQKELAELQGTPIDEDMVSRLSARINDLKALVDAYKETVENRDKTIALRGDTIKKQHETINRANKVIKDFKTIETKETDRLHKIIEEQDRIFAEKDESIGRCVRRITTHLQDKARMQQKIDALEAELSARKGDSDVLMKVVEVIKDDSIPNDQVPCMICGIVDDYLDETTNITDYNISTGTSTKGNESENAVETKVFEIEYPVDRSRTVHLQRMRIAEQSETIKRLVKEVKELRDADQITVNVPTTEQVQPVIDEILGCLKHHGAKVKVEFNVPDGVFLELP